MQIFPKEMMPPHYFEPVMHNGALKWAVLLGNEITIVPTNASELKKCMRFKMDKVAASHPLQLTLRPPHFWPEDG